MITLPRKEVIPLLGEPVLPTGGRIKGWVNFLGTLILPNQHDFTLLKY
jgi:hypothetical protein